MHEPVSPAERHWLRPPLVPAPAAQDFDKPAIYEISPSFLQSHAGIFRRTPIFQVWTHLVGELPPINNVSRLAKGALVPTLTTLDDSVACFEGVNRPYCEEANGESVLVYILRPEVSIAYEPDMACLAKAVRVPAKTVLTVQVQPRKTLQTAADNVDGIVTRLEFVSCGEEDGLILPQRHSDRYGKLLWKRNPK
jgi:hypothetical protein